MNAHEFELIKGWCEANTEAVKELDKLVRQHEIVLARREGSKATWAALGGVAVVVIDVALKLFFKAG